MYSNTAVDVAINVFAKPYQTALSILSLLHHSGSLIDKIYFQFEPYGSQYDTCSPYLIAEYIKERAICFQPQQWIALNPVDISQLHNPTYRHAIRYQYAWEHTDKRYLFIMHNDVFFLKDIITPLLHNIGSSFAIGRVGQCWNCPAANQSCVQESIPHVSPCMPEQYQNFHITSSELKKLYFTAIQKNVFVRPYMEDWVKNFKNQVWPLPECRVNEWACLVNMELSAPLTSPLGPIVPFGAFYPCGSICLDTAVAWFRGIHTYGLRATHMDIHSYLIHWVGSGKMTKIQYNKAEKNAAYLLKKHFPEFISWCSIKNNRA